MTILEKVFRFIILLMICSIIITFLFSIKGCSTLKLKPEKKSENHWEELNPSPLRFINPFKNPWGWMDAIIKKKGK